MAVPKHKTSKERKHKRNSANFRAKAPTLVECPTCHQLKQPHVVCPKCGSYNGKTVISKNEDKKK